MVKMDNSQEINSSVDGSVGHIRLNNPKALNSLTEGMCASIYNLLNDWQDDKGVQVVVVSGDGERAFCAGGDVLQVCNEGKQDPVGARRFFKTEYAMDLAVAEFPKPYICLIDGIIMGGGLGISVNGRYRVMGDNVLAAMPETGIGLLPDVGATAFLNACPGRTGLYLGLTGARLNTADAIYAGFGTHYVATPKHGLLLDALKTRKYGDNPFICVEETINQFSSDPGQSSLKDLQPTIDRLFAANDVEEIVSSLSNDGSDFSSEALKALQRMSPTSMKITAKQVTENPNISVKDALILEYRMVSHVLKRHDLYEGIRAALIDKDRKPVWQPATLAEVSSAEVADHFSSLNEEELVLNSRQS